MWVTRHKAGESKCALPPSSCHTSRSNQSLAPFSVHLFPATPISRWIVPVFFLSQQYLSIIDLIRKSPFTKKHTVATKYCTEGAKKCNNCDFFISLLRKTRGEGTHIDWGKAHKALLQLMEGERTKIQFIFLVSPLFPFHGGGQAFSLTWRRNLHFFEWIGAWHECEGDGGYEEEEGDLISFPVIKWLINILESILSTQTTPNRNKSSFDPAV